MNTSHGSVWQWFGRGGLVPGAKAQCTGTVDYCRKIAITLIDLIVSIRSLHLVSATTRICGQEQQRFPSKRGPHASRAFFTASPKFASCFNFFPLVRLVGPVVLNSRLDLRDGLVDVLQSQYPVATLVVRS